MQSNIPFMALESHPAHLGFASLQTEIEQVLNIRIELCHQWNHRGSDLLHPDRCLKIVQQFAAQIQVKNLTCAGSMLIKYWAVPLLYPYFYSVLLNKPHMPWALDKVVLDLNASWAWDRVLKFNLDAEFEQNMQSPPSDPVAFFQIIFSDLNEVFEVLGRVAKVPKVLLWENTALRILQFYDLMARRQISAECLARIKAQRASVQMLYADDFGLAKNPFKQLFDAWSNRQQCYQRQKCCFYFQLPEAAHDYCKNCPLQQRSKLREKHQCKHL